MKEEASLEKVKLSTQAGIQAEINGTPSFFYQWKKNYKAMTLNLQSLHKIYQEIKSQ